MRNKALLFDLDGTLFDTNEVNYYAYNEALKPFEVQIDYGYFCEKCNGRHYTRFLPPLLASETDVENVHNNKKKLYSKYLHKAKINKYLETTIWKMKDECLLGIVTTASRKNTEEILECFKMKNIFDLILCQEDIGQTKPNPEGYIKAMSLLDVSPKNTVIFEDSDVGVAAAVASNAKVMRVVVF